MHDYVPFVIIGISTGAVYALASLGLVLTYRTSGVFNFGYGAVGMFCTYMFYSLRQHVPTSVAVIVAVLIVAPMVGVVIDLMFRRLAGAGPVAATVASLGLLVGLQGLAVIIYGGATRRLASIFPTTTYRAFDLNIGIDQTLIVAVAAVAGLALIVFFRVTHVGLQTRAVVDNRALAGLVGTNARTITRLSWMLGCAFTATSGILFAPLVGLDSVVITLLVVEAFGAAAVGRLYSFPRTALAAVGLGVAQSVSTKILGDIGNTSLAGIPRALPFFLLFVVLLFSRGTTLREAPTTRLVRSRGSGKVRFRFPLRSVAVTFAVALALPPFLSGSRVLTLTTTLIFVVIFASLRLLIGVSRQLSLCHAVFVVLGATTLAHLQSADVPYLVALLVAGAVVVPIGAALAFPAIRLSSLYLGLATFGFGILAQNLLFPAPFVFGTSVVLDAHRPALLAGDTAFCYFTLAVAIVAVAALELLRVSRLGRILVGLADSPVAIGSLGITPLATRVITFCVSAFFAGIAGGLLISLFRSVSPESFTFFQSLLWVTVLVVGGAQSFAGVVLAAVLLVAVSAVFTASWVTEWQPVLFGLAAVGLAQTENGLAGVLCGVDFTSLAERSRWRLRSQRGFERLVRVAAVEEATPV